MFKSVVTMRIASPQAFTGSCRMSNRFFVSALFQSEAVFERPYSTSAVAQVKAPKPSKATTISKTELGYNAKKLAEKERRREQWQAHQQRLERLKVRRNPDRFQKRTEFRSFFVPEKVNNEYMDRKARQSGLEWKLNVAVILQRCNVVLEDKEDWESEFENLRDYLWQFGKDYPKGLNLESGTNNPISDEELMALLPEGFIPASRITEADRSGNVKTTDRKLKTSIYLMVKESGFNDWRLPTVVVNAEETLLEASKRALKEKVGSNVEFWCPSNCPVAVNMSAFSPEEQELTGLFGTKTFFMKVQYDEGDVKELEIDDFAWLDREEIVERIRVDKGDGSMVKFYHYLL